MDGNVKGPRQTKTALAYLNHVKEDCIIKANFKVSEGNSKQ